MTLKGVLVLTGGRIPQPNRVVIAPTSKRVAIWGECHGQDSLRMPIKGLLMFSGGDLPQANRAVSASTSERTSIWGIRT